MVIRVGIHTIEREVTQAATASQIEMLEELSTQGDGRLKVCVLYEEMLFGPFGTA